MKTLALIVLALGGCTDNFAWEDGGYRAVVEVPGVDADAWAAEVDGAVGEWNDALAVVGCAPAFHASPDGNPIALVEREGSTGYMEAGFIHIKPVGARKRRMALLHELGHALGLEHDESQPGVMNANPWDVGGVQAIDVARALAVYCEAP